MPILALETSTLQASVALMTESGKLIAEQSAERPEGHGGGLMPLVVATCKEAGVAAAELTGVAVALGPGTFTGLRVGLATAKAIAVGRHIPIVGIPTLTAFAQHGGSFEGIVVPMLDARRAEIYAAAFDDLGAAPILEEQVVDPRKFAMALAMQGKRALCFGQGLLRYHETFVEILGEHLVEGEATMTFPRAAFVAQLALPRLTAGEGDQLDRLIPRYLRKSYAEQNRKS